MSKDVIQTSFHAGEWAPALNARVDLAKYHAGVALATNFFVDYRGGLSSRTGTRYVIAAYDSSEKVRLIPFQASDEVTYVLEFGELYIRFLNNGSPVLKTALNITGITNANPCVVSVVNTIALGNWVFIDGVGGMTQLNGQYFKVIARSAGTITLGNIFDGAGIDSTAYGVWTAGGTVSEQYLLPTTYTGNDLALLKFTQNVDKMIICHPDFHTATLTLVAPTNWTLLDVVYGPAISPPVVITATPVNLPGAVGTGVFYGYTVAAVNVNGEESVATTPQTTSQIADMRTTAGSVLLGWGAVAGAQSYNVYKVSQGHAAVPSGAQYGFIGNVTGTALCDTNTPPDYSQTIQVSFNPFTGGNPQVPVYWQQRLWLMGQTDDVQAFHATQPGTDYNFNYTRPALDDNGISGRLVSQQLNTIRAALPAPNGLIVLTDRQAWLINAGTGGNSPVTPSQIVANEQAFNGISNVPPIKANFDLLYVQAKGAIVRNLSYKFESNVFTGTDITVLSSHLFTGYNILEWAWAEEPYKVVWAIRNDGVMLTCTFVKEQELIGWCHSTTDGTFESVCTVTEGTDFGDVDAVYVVVRRTRGLSTLRYIERLTERIYPNGRIDAWSVDSGLHYEGAPTTTFSNLNHLAGKTVTGVADGEVIAPIVVSATGVATLPTAASNVTLGLAFVCDFQTLRLDVGLPTIQGTPKKTGDALLRVDQTLGLKIGTTFDTLTDMQDLIVGNLNEQDNVVITDLYTGDARTNLDPNWTTQGQICVRQDQPYPATLLGIVTGYEVATDDTGEK